MHEIDPSQASKNAWGLIKPYWVSEAKGRAYALLAAVVALDLVSVGLLVVFTQLRKVIYDSLEKYQQGAFMMGVAQFFAAACVFIALAVYKLYLRQSLEIHWREWLTKACLGAWMRPGVPARMELQGKSDNPDQRVTEDAASLCSLTLGLGLGLLTSIVTLASFFVLLWTVSGPLDFKVGGVAIHIPGYMAWVAVAYAMVGSWLNHLVGRRLISQSVEQQRVEADLRFSLMRARESSEAIALLGGETAEKARAERLFGKVRQNWTEIMVTTKRLTGFGVGYSQVAGLFPLVVAAPRYFARSITLGDLMQISSAFGEVQGALSWFIGSYSSWVSWKAAATRLRSFFAAVEMAGAAPELSIARVAGAEPKSNGAALLLPSGAPLLDVGGFRAPAGSWTLIQGPSGSGKSSLLKAFSGLWRHGSGSLEVPEGSFFVPQKPFVPSGSLEEALCYPRQAGSEPRALGARLGRRGARFAPRSAGRPGLGMGPVPIWRRGPAPGVRPRLPGRARVPVFGRGDQRAGRGARGPPDVQAQRAPARDGGGERGPPRDARRLPRTAL